MVFCHGNLSNLKHGILPVCMSVSQILLWRPIVLDFNPHQWPHCKYVYILRYWDFRFQHKTLGGGDTIQTIWDVDECSIMIHKDVTLYLLPCLHVTVCCQLTLAMGLPWLIEGTQRKYSSWTPKQNLSMHSCAFCLCLLKFCPLPHLYRIHRHSF